MKFLVDNQLPRALCALLKNSGHEGFHVLELGMDEKADAEIWEHAKSLSMIVVSKDEDFVHLANRVGDDGKLLWVRIGNCRKQHLFQRFEATLANIGGSFANGARIVEIR